MIYLYLVYRFVEGRCHGNQLILGKYHERRLIPLAFFAQLFENELQYHCLNVRTNSGDDVAIACHYRATAMLSAVYAVVVCLSVCLCVCVCVCVCVSVTLRYCIKMAKRRITQTTPHDSPMTLVF